MPARPEHLSRRRRRRAPSQRTPTGGPEQSGCRTRGSPGRPWPALIRPARRRVHQTLIPSLQTLLDLVGLVSRRPAPSQAARLGFAWPEAPGNRPSLLQRMTSVCMHACMHQSTIACCTRKAKHCQINMSRRLPSPFAMHTVLHFGSGSVLAGTITEFGIDPTWNTAI